MLQSSDLTYSLETLPRTLSDPFSCRHMFRGQVAELQQGTHKVLTDINATLVSIDGAQWPVFSDWLTFLHWPMRQTPSVASAISVYSN